MSSISETETLQNISVNPSESFCCLGLECGVMRVGTFYIPCLANVSSIISQLSPNSLFCLVLEEPLVVSIAVGHDVPALGHGSPMNALVTGAPFPLTFMLVAFFFTDSSLCIQIELSTPFFCQVGPTKTFLITHSLFFLFYNVYLTS